MFDVVIVGAGPAGLALAAETVERGLRTVVVDPCPDAGWPATYGIWLDEAERVGVATVVGHRWTRPLAGLWSHLLTLQRTYALVDKEALQGSLRSRFEREGGTFVVGRAASVEHARRHSDVVLDTGDRIRAATVVDATGTGRFLTRQGRATAWQTAHGWVAQTKGLPWSDDEMVLMAFQGVGADQVPSFLYALPLGGGQVLLEETVLASSPRVPTDELQPLLARRVERLGIDVTHITEHERVSIPMNPPLPSRRQRTLGFGAAASFVHPATGYTLARTLETAPRLADALVATRGLRPGPRSRALWRVIWSPSQVRAYRLAALGLDVVMRLPPAQVGPWMHAFFEMPTPVWSSYLSASSSAWQRFVAMVHLGRFLSAGLIAHAAGRSLLYLTQGLRLPRLG